MVMKKHYYIYLVAVGMALTAFVKQATYSMDELMGITRPQLEGVDYNLRPEAAKAFEKMKKAAALEGISLYSLSSYRSYDHQNRIWNRKWTNYYSNGLRGLAIATKIIRYSTIPGTSRHHWGTDLDVIDASLQVNGDKLLPQHYQQGGVYEKLGAWLKKHAEEYGFYLVYTSDASRKGFKYEPWHLSYKKLAQPMLKVYLSNEWKSKIKEVKGGEFMTDDFLEKYGKENIQDINPDLL